MQGKQVPRRRERALQVSLGKGWLRFTYAREDMILLGVVQIGMQIGALAQLPDGGYAQVNGDFIQSLNKSQIAHRLQLRRERPSDLKGHVDIRPVGSQNVTVTVRKRRSFEPPTK